MFIVTRAPVIFQPRGDDISLPAAPAELSIFIDVRFYRHADPLELTTLAPANNFVNYSDSGPVSPSGPRRHFNPSVHSLFRSVQFRLGKELQRIDSIQIGRASCRE